MISLYDKPECPFCYRIRLLLGHLGADHEVLPYDEPEHDRAWRALSHARTVPVLVEGDVVLCDSAVIIEYLEDRFGGVLPDGIAARARARTLVQYADTHVGRAIREVIFEKRAKPEADWDRERIERGAAGYRESLPFLERALGDGEYFSGSYSAADAALTGRVALAFGYGVELPEDAPRLRRWFETRVADSFFADASPPRVREWIASR